MKKDRDEIIREINIFKECRKDFVKYAEILELILKKIVKKISPESIVQTRAKTVTSYAEKIQRPGKAEQYGPNPVEDLTDLCGGRFILPTLDDVKKCCQIIEENFQIQWKDSEDKLAQLEQDQFGYLSHHYIVQLNPNSSYIQDLNIPNEIFPLKAEIQVRTLLQHCWSVIQHDNLYKPSIKIPDKIKRQFYRIAAILEDADHEFQNGLDFLSIYEANYGAYMSAQEINDQIRILELVYENAPDKSKELNLVLRIVKLARAVEKWDLIIKLLSDFVNYTNSSALRELGLALYKYYAKNPTGTEYQQGQKYLEEAIKLDPEDTDALTCLGGSWKRLNLKRAHDYFNQSYNINPDDTYTGVNYFITNITLNKNIDILDYSLPAIKNIIKMSEEQISVGINMPWAYFNNGLFKLFSKEINESLHNYLLGIRFSTAGWMISSHLSDLDSLSIVDDKLQGIELVRHLLILGLAIRFNDKDALNRLKKEFGVKEGDLSIPLAIITGSTKLSKEELGPDIQRNLIEALKFFEGTIISGSTVAGVCDLVGEVQSTYPNSIKTVGYIPKNFPEDVKVDERFLKIHQTNGNDFSFLEALHYWTDIVLNELTISKIKLIGIGGGKISAFEYRLALVFGAFVGILEKFVGSGTELLQDSTWKCENLTNVENNSDHIKKFLTQ
jgi:ppGpp synthetase/RelA/SpoT-type nucleotidyltranferase